jgi:hypothetical protein
MLSACGLLSSRKQKRRTNMAKPLSEQLANLSIHAKKAEDSVAAAQKETHDKIMARWEQARADATATTSMSQADRHFLRTSFKFERPTAPNLEVSL